MERLMQSANRDDDEGAESDDTHETMLQGGTVNF